MKRKFLWVTALVLLAGVLPVTLTACSMTFMALKGYVLSLVPLAPVLENKRSLPVGLR